MEIVDSFDIFHTGQGSQGILARPSKQELETVFETSNANAIVEIILQKGRIISSDAPPKWGGTNDSSYVASLPLPSRTRLTPSFFCLCTGAAQTSRAADPTLAVAKRTSFSCPHRIESSKS